MAQDPRRRKRAGEATPVTVDKRERSSTTQTGPTLISIPEEPTGTVELSLFSCPICGEFPRTFLYYSCANGHTVCDVCHLLVRQHAAGVDLRRRTCSLCRDPNVRIDKFAERLALQALATTTAECVNRIYGCMTTGLLSHLSVHEPYCPRREVTCPGKHGHCEWVGSYITLLRHLRDGHCVEFVQPRDGRGWTAETSLFDFAPVQNAQSRSVLDQRTLTRWRPFLLDSYELTPYLIYAKAWRSATGNWYVAFYSLAPQEQLPWIRITADILSAEIPSRPAGTPASQRQPDLPVYSYSGGVLAHGSTSIEAAQGTGRYVLLADHQVRELRRGPVLFRIRTTVSITGPAFPMPVELTVQMVQVANGQEDSTPIEVPSPVPSPVPSVTSTTDDEQV